MTVHIDELHSDIAPGGGDPPASPSNTQSPGWIRDELVASALRRREWLEARTAAEAFSD
jgi:hypothetical protein